MPHPLCEPAYGFDSCGVASVHTSTQARLAAIRAGSRESRLEASHLLDRETDGSRARYRCVGLVEVDDELFVPSAHPVMNAAPAINTNPRQAACHASPPAVRLFKPARIIIGNASGSPTATSVAGYEGCRSGKRVTAFTTQHVDRGYLNSKVTARLVAGT